MGQEVLVEAAIQDGKRLIAALASEGLSIQRAFWYYFAESEEWRLVIESRSVSEQGPIAAYTRVDSLLETIKPPLHLSLSDIALLPSAQHLIDDMRWPTPTRSDRTVQVLDSPEVTGVMVRGAYIYYVENIARQSGRGGR